jgi:hypothetical protein
MNFRFFTITVLLTLLLLNAFPIYQAITTDGYLYYTNAYDETSYLQYDFAIKSKSPSRVGEYIVIFFHRIGLSGGWINFILDLTTFLIFIFLLRAIFKQLKFSEHNANAAAYLTTVLPFLFNGLNPLISRLFAYNLSSGFIYWFTMPEGAFLPIVRSPEPQVSLIIMLMGICFSLKLKSFFPAYLCMPILYPFIVVPYAFIVIALHIKMKYTMKSPSNLVLPLFLSFSFLAIALTIYFNFYIEQLSKEFLVNSHYPLLSFSSILSLTLYLAIYRHIREDLRYVVLVIILSPMIAANLQIITGWIVQPNAYEQYVGVYCVALVFVFAMISVKHAFFLKTLSLSLCFILAILSCYTNFYDNYRLSNKLKLTPDLLFNLKNDSQHVAINDTLMASVLDMVFPRQPSTFFGYERTFALFAKSNIDGYLCAKKEINGNGALNNAFRETFKRLDSAYKYGNKDFILVTLNRKNHFTIAYDPEAVPSNCSPSNLHYYLIKTPES